MPSGGNIPESEQSTIRHINHVDATRVAASTIFNGSLGDTACNALPAARDISPVDSSNGNVSYGSTTNRENPSGNGSEDSNSGRNSDWPDAGQFQAMRKAFRKASLSYMPAARMILCIAPSPEGIKLSDVSEAVNIPLTLSGWEMFGVVQRAEAASFDLALKFYDRVATLDSKQGALLDLKCAIVYHPGNDSCILFNRGHEAVYVGNIEARQRKRVEPDGHEVLCPGYWRASVGVGENERTVECLFDFLILQRRFRVSLCDMQLNPKPDGKRGIPDSYQQGRHQNAKLLRGEIQTVSQQSSSNCLESVDTEHITDSIAVLDLEDGQKALMRTTAAETGYSTSDDEAALELYNLTRISSIANNRATTVFTCKHTGIAVDQIVAKVLRYGRVGEDARRLWSAAASWTREMTFLKDLKHVSVSYVKGFRSRFRDIIADI